MSINRLHVVSGRGPLAQIKADVKGEPRTVAADGSKDVASAGTAVALSATSVLFKSLIVQAKEANTQKIAVGGSTIDMTRGTILVPLSSKEFKDGDLADIFIDANVSGEGVTFSYEV